MDSDHSDDSSHERSLDDEIKQLFYSCVDIYVSILAAEAHNQGIVSIPRGPRRYASDHGWRHTCNILSNPEDCFTLFRMTEDVFRLLCATLVNDYGLRHTREVRGEEALAMFLVTVGHNDINRRNVAHFGRSRETVSRKFDDVLEALVRLSAVIVRPRQDEFQETYKKIRSDGRFWPYFKDCIGAIDGTHIPVIVPRWSSTRYYNRKGEPSQNVLAICNFDMLFTFVSAGTPGFQHDDRVLTYVTDEESFPHPPPGKYYLADSGYAIRTGYMTPFRGERYHIQQFRSGGSPRNVKELFNYRHSSLRSVIERTFGVWKNKWKILKSMKPYRLEKQIKLVAATMALHNFIRIHARTDHHFFHAFRDESYEIDDMEIKYNNPELENEMGRIRNDIALAISQAGV